jgi:hypothetical protein
MDGRGNEDPITETDAATDMCPKPQPTGPTPTQKILEDLPDFKMYKELAIVEV